jgi:hypothetical protein
MAFWTSGEALGKGEILKRGGGVIVQTVGGGFTTYSQPYLEDLVQNNNCVLKSKSLVKNPNGKRVEDDDFP